MTYKTHVAGGIALALIIDTQLDLPLKQDLLLYFGTFLGSIIVDIDHPDSKIGKDNPFAHLMNGIFGHRTFTHSLAGILTTMVLVFAFGGIRAYTVGIGIGYLSHLILDMMTVSGIPIFYPEKKRYSIMSLKTGSNGETAVFGILLMAICVIVFA